MHSTKFQFVVPKNLKTTEKEGDECCLIMSHSHDSIEMNKFAQMLVQQCYISPPPHTKMSHITSAPLSGTLKPISDDELECCLLGSGREERGRVKVVFVAFFLFLSLSFFLSFSVSLFLCLSVCLSSLSLSQCLTNYNINGKIRCKLTSKA